MLLVNRDTGDAISIGMYEDENAARSFAPKAEKLAESLKKYQSESTSRRELYEGAASTQIEAEAGGASKPRAFKAPELGGGARGPGPQIQLTRPPATQEHGPDDAN